MKICIRLTVEPDVARSFIKQVLKDYRLQLITDNTPVILLPDGMTCLVFCETDDPEVLDMLDIDDLIDGVYYDPEFIYDLDTPSDPAKAEKIDQLNKLLEKDVDFGNP